ncbi:MAG: DNA polymerase III subunit gamma/tau [Actinobacteria bacterium]|nr:DNA polymerase III subunit gamma/tau [Actinomycetota bacterium]
MEHQALYRRYRPQRFDEVIGQAHVTETLSREVIDEKIAHAYLFAGPRGTGKTTTARLLAKALNCTDPQANGEPCNSCVSCEGITSGTSLDVIELDAASHNKVEDIREIRINVGTVAAAGGARRIYILDEAHMLSRAAGNALLKTLEEPPGHVVFVLATTEPYKVLDTIRSRCQRFDFHPVQAETLGNYLGEIARRESFTVDQQALSLVASHAQGSVRDAMSLLEQVAALGAGTVNAAGVTRALGLADSDAYTILATAIVEQDAPAALGLVARLSSQGTDLRRFVSEGVSFFRGVFLAQYAPNLEEIVEEPPDAIAQWRTVAKTMPVSDVLRSVDQLAEALLNLRQGREERLVVELAVLRLARPDISPDAEALDSRIAHLEGRVRDLAAAVANGGAGNGGAASSGAAPAPQASFAPPGETAAPAMGVPPTTEPAPPATHKEETPGPDASDTSTTTPLPLEAAQPPADVQPATTLALEQCSAIWPSVVARVRDVVGPRRHALLKEASPSRVDGATLILAVPEHLPFHLEQLRHDDELMIAVGRIVAESSDGTVEVQFEGATDSATPGAATGSAERASKTDQAGATDSLETEPERVPDKDDLLNAGEAGTDPTTLVQDILGGEIVKD